MNKETQLYKVFFFLAFCSTTLSAYAVEPAPFVGQSLNNQPCKIKHTFGPFADYTKNKSQLKIVEDNHFTPDVEALIKGASSTLESDISYTLLAFPNHPRALLSLIRYDLDIKKGIRKGGLQTPPECYLNRAINFSPKDPVPYSLYGYYLSKRGHHEKAGKLYEKAIELDPENLKIKYGYGLFLVETNKYSEALEIAKQVYAKEKNAPTGLKNKLKEKGHWTE